MAVDLAKNLSNITKLQRLKCSKSKWSIVLQPIKLAPKDSIEVKAGGKNHTKLRKETSSRLKKFANNSIAKPMTAKKLSQLEQQLESDIKALCRMICETSCLIKDFQFLIDPWTGKIYHLDFDRCYGKYNPKKYPSQRRIIFDYMLDFKRELINIHRYPSNESSIGKKKE